MPGFDDRTRPATGLRPPHDAEQREPRRDDPTTEVFTEAVQRSDAVKGAWPSGLRPLAEKPLKQAQGMWNDVLTLQQVDENARAGLAQGTLTETAAANRRKARLEQVRESIGKRRLDIAEHTDGLEGVLMMRAFPQPERGDTSAETKSDLDRWADTVEPEAFPQAFAQRAREALRDGDTSVVAQLMGRYGSELMTKRIGREDAAAIMPGVRAAIIEAASSEGGALKAEQRAALVALAHLPDMGAAVDAWTAAASWRYDDVLKGFPEDVRDDRADQTWGSLDALRDPLRSRR